jgi:hypothetical protein
MGDVLACHHVRLPSQCRCGGALCQEPGTGPVLVIAPIATDLVKVSLSLGLQCVGFLELT